MECEKKAFVNINDARIRLTEIVLNSDMDIKPIRVYKCEYCGKYHLTSKSHSAYDLNTKKKRKAIQTRNWKREKSFIKRESEYWENYYEIN